MGFNPVVDEAKCVGCEECVDVCPVNVFEMQDGKSVPVNEVAGISISTSIPVYQRRRSER